MEVFLRDEGSGEQCPVEVELDGTVAHLKEAACQALEYPCAAGALQLSVDGASGGGGGVLDDEEPLSCVAGLEAGCTVAVRMGDFSDELAALRTGAADLAAAPLWMRGWRDAVLAAAEVPSFRDCILHITAEHLKADREVVLAAIRQCPSALRHAHVSLREDREVVLAAVHHPYAVECPSFKYAGDALRADRDLALAAISKHPTELKYAHASLRDDREVVLAALRHRLAPSESILEHASDSLRADREFALAAIHRHGASLEFVHESLKADPAVVLGAVRRDGTALRFAHESLKSDRDIVFGALLNNPCGTGGHALQYASDSVRADRHVVLEAVRKFPEALCHAHDSLKADPRVVSAAVKQDLTALRFVSKHMTDRNLTLSVVQKDGACLEYAHKSLRRDRRIVLAAAQNNPKALIYADPSLRSDVEVSLAVVNHHNPCPEPAPLSYLGKTSRANRRIVLAAVRNDTCFGTSLRHAHISLKADRMVVLAAVTG
eukprot:TRINITY_DN13747_c0_g1_i1.p1 TRINITY_DN13747_c0_g1~~TRINITY_DN13747_c0_g1_i1.p1  ORF type:complete len:492 (+),score=24.14 TRINITY_DN13747_c0_g1_i1:156-1631(+)